MFDDFGAFLKTMRVYLFGRGIVSLGVILATFAAASFGPLTLAPALVIALGGVGLNSFMRLREEGLYQQSMVDLYRDDIAEHLGKAPADVTRADLKEAAKYNDVIDQALIRERKKTRVAIVTSVLAGLTTFGLLFAGFAPMVTDFFRAHFAPNMANILQYASSGIISSTSGLIVHDGLEAAIGLGTGLNKAAAHDRILAMERDVARERTITPEQVYSVLVASDAELAHSIRTRFRQSYEHMPERRQHQVLEAMEVTADMQALATAINAGRIRPGHLAYITNDSCINARGEKTEDGKPCVNFIKQPEPTTHEAAHSFVEKLQAERAANTYAALTR